MTTKEILLTVLSDAAASCLLDDAVTVPPYFSGLGFHQNIIMDNSNVPCIVLHRPISGSSQIQQTGSFIDIYSVTIRFIGGETPIDGDQDIQDPLIIIASKIMAQFKFKVGVDQRLYAVSNFNEEEEYYKYDRTVTGIRLTFSVSILTTTSVCA